MAQSENGKMKISCSYGWSVLLFPPFSHNTFDFSTFFVCFGQVFVSLLWINRGMFLVKYNRKAEDELCRAPSWFEASQDGDVALILLDLHTSVTHRHSNSPQHGHVTLTLPFQGLFEGERLNLSQLRLWSCWSGRNVPSTCIKCRGQGSAILSSLQCVSFCIIACRCEDVTSFFDICGRTIKAESDFRLFLQAGILLFIAKMKDTFCFANIQC